MSDRKGYYQEYYQKMVKPKREQEKEAFNKLPLALRDLSAEKVRNQLLTLENNDLRDKVSSLTEDLQKARNEIDKLVEYFKHFKSK